MKIMIVEDDVALREIYSIRVAAEGYEIVTAGDGEEALAVAVREKPDLILSDVMMPKISGFDMLDILRSTPEIAKIKVVMMTALSSDEHRDRGEKLGADRYLVKSQVGIEDVVNVIHEVLGDKEVAKDAPAASVAAPGVILGAAATVGAGVVPGAMAGQTPMAVGAPAATANPVQAGANVAPVVPQAVSAQAAAPAAAPVVTSARAAAPAPAPNVAPAPTPAPVMVAPAVNVNPAPTAPAQAPVSPNTPAAA